MSRIRSDALSAVPSCRSRPAVPESSHRPFGVADAMILVVALAVASSWLRGMLPDLVAYCAGRIAGRTWYALAFNHSRAAIMVSATVLASLTPAVCLIRLRRPRPGLRRLARYPGAAACGVATAALALLVAWLSWSHALHGNRFVRFPMAWFEQARPVAFAVMGTWATLAAAGRWRSGVGWIERSGRAVGAGWIAVLLLEWISYLII